MPDASILTLEGFGVAFRDRVVLADVTLDIPWRGVSVVMGPAGGGKSTLLRTLAGLNESQPELRTWGTALYEGARIGLSNRPALVQQDARYFVSTVRENIVSAFPDRAQLQKSEQNARIEALLGAAGVDELGDFLDDDALSLSTPQRRLLGVVRAMAGGAPLVCLDETTAGLEPESAERVMGLMRWYARRHAVLFVTHHQLHARGVADTCFLLGGGRVQEASPAPDFFERPTSAVTRHFLTTGSVALPSPDAEPDELADDVTPPPPLPAAARAPASANMGPRGFRWLRPGVLGGLPRPGIVGSVEEDLEALRRLGVTTLVTLEETPTVPLPALEAAEIEGVHFPVVDMEAPETVATVSLCQRVEKLLEGGHVVAFHCRAGQGRTGTLLACQLIWEGVSAVAALDGVRCVNPKWVTSDVQVQFLETFSDFVRWQHGPASGHAAPAAQPNPHERKKDVA